MNLKHLLAEKPLRWACHQMWGQKKGEIVYRNLRGPAGALFDRYAEPQLATWFDEAIAKAPDIIAAGAAASVGGASASAADTPRAGTAGGGAL